MAESLQVSIDMVAVAILGIIALCVQGKYFITPKPDWIEPLNLYVLIAAKPSERKTPTLSEVSRPIYDYVSKENETRKPEYDRYIIEKKVLSKKVSALTDAASKPKAKSSLQDVIDAQKELSELEEVTFLKMIVDDITPEALVKAMKENDERMAIITAEGGIFGMLSGRYSNQPNIDIFLKAYSGESYSTDRIGRECDNLNKPLLTIVIMLQHIVLDEAINNKEFRERGFLARFLYSLPESKVGARSYEVKAINSETRQAYNDLVNELLNIGGKYGWNNVNGNLIKLDAEAYALSKTFFDSIEKKLADEYEKIEDWVGKYHGQTMRIAGLLHCIKYKGISPNVELEGKTMKEAILIGEYFLNHAMAAFKMAGLSIPQEEKEAKYILKHIDARKIREIRKKELFDILRGHFSTVEEMQPALNELAERNYIRIDKTQNGKAGRPTEIITVNPKYWESKEKI